MGATEEDWVTAAMADDTLVAELLLRLRASASPPPPPRKPLEWSVRQRRSKHPSASVVNPRKPSQRASPTTPLSWSFATSLSGGSGGAGDEESSRTTSQKPRSKVDGESEEKTPSKRMRKKTLVELKDEQNSLIKDRRELKRELSALRLKLEKQRATNENLKRIKFELQPVPDTDTETASAAEESISGQLHHTATAHAVTLQPSNSKCCPELNPDTEFVLPDLNMPFEDPCLEVVFGVS